MKPLYPVRSRTYRQECRVYSGHRNEPFMQVSKEPQMKSAIPYPAFSIQKTTQRVPSISRRASSTFWRSCARDFPTS